MLGRWYAQLNFDPELGWRGTRTLVLNWYWPRPKGDRFGYFKDWYDGVHRTIILGPVNLYWNW